MISDLIRERSYDIGVGLGEDSKGRVGRRHMDPQQTVVMAGRLGHGVKQLSPIPTGLFAGTETPVSFRIATGDLQSVKEAWLRIRMTTAAATCKLIPAEHWCRMIELYSVKNGQLIQRFYGDTLWALNGWKNPQEYERIAHTCYHTDHWSQSDDTYPIGAVVDAYIPLHGIFTEGFKEGFHVGALSPGSDIQVKLFFRASIVSAASVATFTINDLELHFNMITHSVSEAIVERRRLGFYMSNIISTDYLDPLDNLSRDNVTINVGANTEIALDSLDKKTVAFILMGIRASSTTVTGGNLTNFRPLPPNTVIDLISPGGSSILGGETGVTAKFLKDCFQNDGILRLPGEMAKYTNLYLINFARSPRAASAIKSGMFFFDSTNYRLRIRPHVATTNEVQTVTPSVVPTSGNYRFSFAGEFSAPLAFNANAATQKAAFEAMKVCMEWPNQPLTITPSAALSAGANTTYTFLNSGERHPLIEIVENTMAGAGPAIVTCSTAVTTFPVEGWVNAATYNVALYAFCYKNVSKIDGSLVVQDF